MVMESMMGDMSENLQARGKGIRKESGKSGM